MRFLVTQLISVYADDKVRMAGLDCRLDFCNDEPACLALATKTLAKILAGRRNCEDGLESKSVYFIALDFKCI